MTIDNFNNEDIVRFDTVMNYSISPAHSVTENIDVVPACEIKRGAGWEEVKTGFGHVKTVFPKEPR